MIHEKPVISTNLPTGVPYVNQHKNTGLIVTPGNIKELATAMETLWNNHDMRKQFGKNAKKRCLNNFTQAQMLDRTAALMTTLKNAKN